MMPLWRSMLFVPATAERHLQKAHLRGADALYLDLEDSIAPSQKSAARARTRDAARHAGQTGTPVLVRINRPWRMAIADLEAAIWPEVSGIHLPKIDSAAHVRVIEEVMTELEAERGLSPRVLTILIETPEGLANVREIAKASPRIRALSLGGEDFAAAIGMPEPDEAALLPFMQQVQLAAREAGVLAHGYPGSIANFTDLDTYRASAERARRLGFDGGACIHPAQVPILNDAFSPTAEEIADAESLLAAYDKALASGEGAIEHKGRMIDIPVANRARRILAMCDPAARAGRGQPE